MGIETKAANDEIINVPTIAFPMPPAEVASFPGGSGSSVKSSKFICELPLTITKYSYRIQRKNWENILR